MPCLLVMPDNGLGCHEGASGCADIDVDNVLTAAKALRVDQL